jgi:hypothetical protein
MRSQNTYLQSLGIVPRGVENGEHCGFANVGIRGVAQDLHRTQLENRSQTSRATEHPWLEEETT